ncbi:MAG: FkbM family methyltransferase [bacterium]|nr:FkbM family methyltransferase [bacterium]
MRLIARKCSRFLECYENAAEYAFRRNGEQFVLRALEPLGIRCVLDVGANVGDWAMLAGECLPCAAIHCFEIIPDTAAQLQRRTTSISRITVNDFGLSNQPGEVRMRFFPEVSSIATMTEYPHEFEHVHVTGQVRTGDAYLDEQGIERVDFLKLDVEGAESLVLSGFERAFREKRIEVVQFEYGQVSILTKYMLRDFYTFLNERGYTVGKIYPGHVEFREYAFAHEDFRGSNHLAIRTERVDLIDAVS